MENFIEALIHLRNPNTYISVSREIEYDGSTYFELALKEKCAQYKSVYVNKKGIPRTKTYIGPRRIAWCNVM